MFCQELDAEINNLFLVYTFLLIIGPSHCANRYPKKIVSVGESHCWFSHYVSPRVPSVGVSISADCGAVSVGSCDTAKEACVTELGLKLS